MNNLPDTYPIIRARMWRVLEGVMDGERIPTETIWRPWDIADWTCYFMQPFECN